jgi:hypothetical protein
MTSQIAVEKKNLEVKLNKNLNPPETNFCIQSRIVMKLYIFHPRIKQLGNIGEGNCLF